jgi:hypothetical protein
MFQNFKEVLFSPSDPPGPPGTQSRNNPESGLFQCLAMDPPSEIWDLLLKFFSSSARDLRTNLSI